MSLIWERRLLKQDCISVILPSVEELPVISKCTEMSDSISLASKGKSSVENPEEWREIGSGEGVDDLTGARTLPMGDSDFDFDRVDCDRFFFKFEESSISWEAMDISSSTVLPSRSLTPDELAASINGMRLWSFSIF